MNSKVRVAGFWLKVIHTNDLPSDTNGHCDVQNRTIFVRDDLPEDEKACVLFHEMGHFIWYRMFGSAENTDEEGFCRGMEFISNVDVELASGLHTDN